MARITNTELELPAALDRLTRLVDASQSGPAVPREIRDRARTRAIELIEAIGPGERATSIAAVGYAAELFCAAAVDLAANPPDAARLIERFEEVADVSRVALGREVLRWPQLAQLSTEIAVDVQLALLLTFSDVPGVSLWTVWPGGGLKRVAYAGDLDALSAREAATQLLRQSGPDLAELGSDMGIRLNPDHEPAAGLIAHGEPRRADHRVLLLEAAAPALAAVLERAQLLARESTSEQSVMGSVDRRLKRLRFDLHDGPQQDVHLLANDLALFREQLLPIISEDANAYRIVGRLDDLAAQLVALDGDLRRLSSLVQSPFLHAGSLPDALQQLTDAFAARTGVHPQAELTGDFGTLSESQQMTLLALVREALSNVREHSDARNVTITITSHAQGVDAEVVDDGRGFEPESTLVRAARDGHLGLVGMHERVRMLGGHTRIDSRPGGPTVISASLPAWPSS
jgi:signal transduction histidine kinase